MEKLTDLQFIEKYSDLAQAVTDAYSASDWSGGLHTKIYELPEPIQEKWREGQKQALQSYETLSDAFCALYEQECGRSATKHDRDGDSFIGSIIQNDRQTWGALARATTQKAKNNIRGA